MDVAPLQELADSSGDDILVIPCDITHKAEVIAAATRIRFFMHPNSVQNVLALNNKTGSFV